MLRTGAPDLPLNGLPPWRRFAVNTLEVQPDFRDLLALLNEHKVEYLIVGGYALAFHGAPRFIEVLGED